MRLPTRMLSAFLAFVALGCESDATRPGLATYNLDENATALSGYSPVSYFDPGRPERGDPRYAVTYRGIKYLFTSEAQRETFRADPARYEPAGGGWCAYGLTVGICWKPDPENFEIVGGRLFLFSRTREADARRLWERAGEEAALVARADEYWHSLLEG
jgi:YHS domain-containing protein